MMIETLAHPDTMTAEQFYDYCGGKDTRLELVRGKVIEVSPVAPLHGRLDSRFLRLWLDYVLEHQLGEVFLNTGFVLFQSPDLVRGPDQAFVSNERMNSCPPPERGFWPVAPDLVVEIVPPDDTADDLNDKIGEYLSAGVRLIWVIYPGRRQVYVYRPGQRVQVVEQHSVLGGEDVVPGLEIPLKQFWGA